MRTAEGNVTLAAMPRIYRPLSPTAKLKMRTTSLKKLLHTANILRQVIEQGHTNSADIAGVLNRRHVKRRRGEGAWTSGAVAKVLIDVRKRLKRDLVPVTDRTRSARRMTPKRLASLKRVVRLAVAAGQRKARADAMRLGRMIRRIKAERPFFNNAQIATFLNDRGHLTARGKPWSAANVERVLRVYGKLVANNE